MYCSYCRNIHVIQYCRTFQSQQERQRTSNPTQAVSGSSEGTAHSTSKHMDVRSSVRSGDAKLTRDEARALRRVLPADAICRRRSVVAAASPSNNAEEPSHPPVREVRSDESVRGVHSDRYSPRTRKSLRRVCPKLGFEERRQKSAAATAAAAATDTAAATAAAASLAIPAESTQAGPVSSPLATRKLEGVYGLPGLPSNFSSGSGENSPSAAA